MAPLEEGLARRRDLALTTHNTHKKQISMSLAGFEPVTPSSERPQTHFLDGAVTGIGGVGGYLHSFLTPALDVGEF